MNSPTRSLLRLHHGLPHLWFHDRKQTLARCLHGVALFRGASHTRSVPSQAHGGKQDQQLEKCFDRKNSKKLFRLRRYQTPKPHAEPTTPRVYWQREQPVHGFA